jgi:hypothetical protein
LGLFSRIIETVRDFFTGSEKQSDPIADAVERTIDTVVTDIGESRATDTGFDEEPRSYASFGFDNFSEANEELGIHNVHASISSDGVEVTYNTDEGLVVEHFDRISDFFDDRYDDLIGEGLDVDVDDEYEKAA